MRNSKYRNIDEVSLFNYVPGKINFKGYDVIVHLVAIVHQRFTIPYEEYYKINCELTEKIAMEAKHAGVKQFVFLSTVKVYGDFSKGSKSWSETSACRPVDAYGRSKFAAEQALEKLEDKNFIVSIIRTPLVYGQGVRANMLGLISLVRRSKILPFKDIQNRRNFTAAENLVAFIDRIIDKRISGIFIAMDRNAISTSELIMLISKNLGKRLVLIRTPNFIIKIGLRIFPKFFDRLFGSYEMDNSFTRRILEFEPPLSTEEGIKRMVESFKVNRPA